MKAAYSIHRKGSNYGAGGGLAVVMVVVVVVEGDGLVLDCGAGGVDPAD